MTQTRPTDLAAEAERYLAAIAVFRAEGCEPQWRREPGEITGQRRPAGGSDSLVLLSRKVR